MAAQWLMSRARTIESKNLHSRGVSQSRVQTIAAEGAEITIVDGTTMIRSLECPATLKRMDGCDFGYRVAGL